MAPGCTLVLHTYAHTRRVDHHNFLKFDTCTQSRKPAVSAAAAAAADASSMSWRTERITRQVPDISTEPRNAETVRIMEIEIIIQSTMAATRCSYKGEVHHAGIPGLQRSSLQHAWSGAASSLLALSECTRICKLLA